MIKATLNRETTGDEGTFGVLVFRRWHCQTLELPWRGNARNLSCILPGVYLCRMGTMSRTVGGRRRLYLILNTPGRIGVFIHAGNRAGDVLKGYKSDSLGCPLLGKTRGWLGGQRAVLNSAIAVTELLAYTEGQDFELEILEE